MSFRRKHLNDLFVLDGIANVNARDRILREIVSNTLAHRDYSNAFPAKMIIDDEKIVIENSNLPHELTYRKLCKIYRKKLQKYTICVCYKIFKV